MQTKSFARIGAVAFVAVAITATAIEMRDRPAATPDQPAIAIVPSGAEPLRDKLAQCQAIGLAAASDDLCLRAWKENRRRFLALPAESMGFSSGADPQGSSGAERPAPPTGEKPDTTPANRPIGEER
ncbi:MAG: conjugal transfer protein TrbK [Bradyrhizobium sp.]|nr:conjugal transfer protein TrbK [Bradyrhizobium sp.]